MTPSNGHPVVHFEIGCKDLAGTTAFYTDIFGWTATPIPSASLLDTHSTKGVQGHITSLGHEPHQYVTFYIEVDDIDEMLSRIEKSGGKKLVPPVPLPDGRKFAWFGDPGGNMIGIITKG
jgi:predicted enzyme related to lactoylglutathione lyase